MERRWAPTMPGRTLARQKGHWHSVDRWVGQELGSESRQLDSCFPLHLPLHLPQVTNGSDTFQSPGNG